MLSVVRCGNRAWCLCLCVYGSNDFWLSLHKAQSHSHTPNRLSLCRKWCLADAEFKHCCMCVCNYELKKSAHTLALKPQTKSMPCSKIKWINSIHRHKANWCDFYQAVSSFSLSRYILTSVLLLVVCCAGGGNVWLHCLLLRPFLLLFFSSSLFITAP